MLGALFRRLFLARFMALHKGGRLAFFGAMAHLADRRAFLRHLSPVRKKRWVVYAKPPFAGSEAVLAYLSRYTHRIAISNRRLIAFDASGVTFRYKDYRREGPKRQLVMTLATHEFVRRFLLHLLPRGFHRIRHYGLKASLELTRTLLAVAPLPLTIRRRSLPASFHPVHAAADTWSSSRASPSGGNPAPRRNRPRRSGRSRRDPVRPETTAPRRDCASGNDSARPVDGRRKEVLPRSRWLPATR